MNDTIAIILATYNGEIYLKQQIDSILDQTYKNIKIYIGDDNSKDGTMNIIKAYKNLHPDKITYYQNKTNIGFIKNFEKLLQITKENYIAFSDQDDIWLPNKLEEQIKAIKEVEKKDNLPIMCHSDLTMIDENQKIIYNSFFYFKKYKLKPEKDLGHILGPCGVMGNTMMINKTLKDIILPFPEGIDFHDYYIAVMCELFGTRITIFNSLVYYRIHQNNTSNNKLNPLVFNNIPYKNTQKNITLRAIRKNNKIKKDDLIKINFLIRYIEDDCGFFYCFNIIRHKLLKRSFTYNVLFFLKMIYYTLIKK
ncbi:TPA: glycosyltransferase family 2 protein [Campylobacter lari]|uniref:glycosyltransferase family 2 protein n=1 Tax=Campylobacter sp. FU_497 TaxID=2911610 RepID=UPI0021E690C6|nr:glycosyltransferase family 2 protein [Campylobacter sp. FU_497]MCV3462702.1 glycosyltransferase family 2 protein [Campylobacter sp. FU_497]HEC1758836.1 glycosyltransferase family 2 protein [Campylobacter lari]